MLHSAQMRLRQCSQPLNRPRTFANYHLPYTIANSTYFADAALCTGFLITLIPGGLAAILFHPDIMTDRSKR